MSQLCDDDVTPHKLCLPSAYGKLGLGCCELVNNSVRLDRFWGALYEILILGTSRRKHKHELSFCWAWKWLVALNDTFALVLGGHAFLILADWYLVQWSDLSDLCTTLFIGALLLQQLRSAFHFDTHSFDQLVLCVLRYGWWELRMTTWDPQRSFHLHRTGRNWWNVARVRSHRVELDVRRWTTLK